MRQITGGRAPQYESRSQFTSAFASLPGTSPRASSASTSAWPSVPGALPGHCRRTLDEVPALYALLFPAKGRQPSRFAEPDYFQVHQELKTQGRSPCKLLWDEIRKNATATRRIAQPVLAPLRLWRGPQAPQHATGPPGWRGRSFIDTAALLCRFGGRSTGFEVRKPRSLLACLGRVQLHLRRGYWKARGLPDWIASHQGCSGFLGGVPELLSG